MSISTSGEASGQGGSAGTYLGVWVPGVVTTPIGALSSPASMAARMRAQNASSMRFVRDWISLSSLIPI
jgi:hypothetical protein